MKLNDLIKEPHNQIHIQDSLWKQQWYQMIIEMGQTIINKGFEIKKVISSYSGGGCYHFIIQTNDDCIYHLDSESIWWEHVLHYKSRDKFDALEYKWYFYKSAYKWDDINEYYDKWNHFDFEINVCEHFQMESKLKYKS